IFTPLYSTHLSIIFEVSCFASLFNASISLSHQYCLPACYSNLWISTFLCRFHLLSTSVLSRIFNPFIISFISWFSAFISIFLFYSHKLESVHINWLCPLI